MRECVTHFACDCIQAKMDKHEAELSKMSSDCDEMLTGVRKERDAALDQQKDLRSTYEETLRVKRLLFEALETQRDLNTAAFEKVKVARKALKDIYADGSYKDIASEFAKEGLDKIGWDS